MMKIYKQKKISLHTCTNIKLKITDLTLPSVGKDAEKIDFSYSKG